MPSKFIIKAFKYFKQHQNLTSKLDVELLGCMERIKREVYKLQINDECNNYALIKDDGH